MSKAKSRGASLGIALAIALVGAAVVVGVEGVPNPLSVAAKSQSKSKTITEWIQHDSGGKDGYTYGGTICIVASIPPAPKGMSSPDEALQYYLATQEPQWPRDGWFIDPADRDLGPGVRIYSHAFMSTVSVLQSGEGTWAVPVMPDCLPSSQAQ